VVNEPPRDLRRAGALAPLITALLAKDPGSRPSGPELRAELGRLVAAHPSPPTEVLPVHGPGRPAPPPSGTPPLRGTSQPEVGVAPAGPEEHKDPRAGVAPTHPAEVEDPEAGVPPADPQALERPGARVASAGVAASDDPEIEVRSAGREPPRPLLPPAPMIDRGRGRMVGVLALLVVLGLAGALLAVNLRSGDGGPTAASGTTAGGAGGSRAGGTTRQATSATEAPGTTEAPTTTATAGLPAGWTSFTNRRGSSRVGVPPGFRARTRASYHATVVGEQGGERRVFTVRSQTPSAPLPQASREYRAWARRNLADFREVRYAEDQTYAGHRGAVVFEYEAVRDGRRVQVRHVNFKGRTWGYNVEFIVPADRWDASQGLARQFEQAFQALG
jgi:hypothetical protein